MVYLPTKCCEEEELLGGIKNKLMYEQLEFFFKGLHLTNPSSNKFYSYKNKNKKQREFIISEFLFPQSFMFHQCMAKCYFSM